MRRGAICLRERQGLNAPRGPLLNPIVFHIVQEVLHRRTPEQVRGLAQGGYRSLAVAGEAIAQMSGTARKIAQAAAVRLDVGDPLDHIGVHLRRLQIRDRVGMINPAIRWQAADVLATGRSSLPPRQDLRPRGWSRARAGVSPPL